MPVECDENGDIRIQGFKSSGDWQEIFGIVDGIFGNPCCANSVKTLVFYDGSDPDKVAGGYGQAYDDDDKSSSDAYPFPLGQNNNRVLSATGIVYHCCWERHTPLHELFHTMGAVQGNAPYATSGFHCWDGIDVMCYDDGTFWGGLYNEDRCPASENYHKSEKLPLDCQYDTYFDATEEGGEYLSSHWNTGGLENPFLVEAPAPGVPTVTTTPASSLTKTSAILNGTVKPNGLSTQYRFEYGLTEAYGSKAPIPDGTLGSNLYVTQNVSQIVGSLQPDTTYHFRLVASNAKGTTQGLDQTFTTPSWKILSTLNPSGADDSNLYDVSCEPSPSVCTAVGKSTSSGVDSPLTHRWNGSSWSEQTPAKKTGAAETRLFGVDCPSETRCMAVGSYEVSGGSPTIMAELWNENKWSNQTTPVPAESTSSEFTAVGCNNTAECKAVGSAVIKGVKTAIAEKWVSPTWSLQSIPIPEGASSSQLDGVDCLWSNFCVAVGRYTTSGGSIKNLAMLWNGTSWSLQTLTDPEGATQTTLLDVSCTPSPNRCTAVGGWKNSANEQFTLAYRYNGSTWTLQSTPNPSGSVASVFQEVSCATETSCTAAGSWVKSASNETLAEKWNGTSWSIQGTPNPPGATFSAFFGVSCRSTTCMGVGWSTDGSGVDSTLAETRE